MCHTPSLTPGDLIPCDENKTRSRVMHGRLALSCGSNVAKINVKHNVVISIPTTQQDCQNSSQEDLGSRGGVRQHRMNVLTRQFSTRQLPKRHVFCRDYLQNGPFLSSSTSVRRDIPSVESVRDNCIFLGSCHALKFLRIPPYLRQSDVGSE